MDSMTPKELDQEEPLNE